MVDLKNVQTTWITIKEAVETKDAKLMNSTYAVLNEATDMEKYFTLMPLKMQNMPLFFDSVDLDRSNGGVCRSVIQGAIQFREQYPDVDVSEFVSEFNNLFEKEV